MTGALLGPWNWDSVPKNRRRPKVVPRPGIAREVPASVLLDSATWEVPGGCSRFQGLTAAGPRPVIPRSNFTVGSLVSGPETAAPERQAEKRGPPTPRRGVKE